MSHENIRKHRLPIHHSQNGRQKTRAKERTTGTIVNEATTPSSKTWNRLILGYSVGDERAVGGEVGSTRALYIQYI